MYSTDMIPNAHSIQATFLDELDDLYDRNPKAVEIFLMQKKDEYSLEGNADLYIICSNELASLFRSEGRFRNAIALYEELLTAPWKARLTKENVLTLQMNIASAYREARETDKAMALYEEIRDDLFRNGEGSSLLYADLLDNMGVLCAGTGNPSRGIDYLKESLAILQQKGDKSEKIATAHLNLAAIYNASKDTTASGAELAEAEALFENFPNDPHWNSLCSLKASLAFQRGDYKSASIIYLDLLNRLRSMPGQGSEYYSVLKSLSVLFWTTKDYSQAKKYSLHAVALAKTLYGEDSNEAENMAHFSDVIQQEVSQ